MFVAYVFVALPIWFRKPNPVIFVPCDFAAVALYLLYINWALDGNWFLSFALPVLGGVALMISALIALLKYVKKGRLFMFGGFFILLGAFMMLLEFLMVYTFQLKFTFWSLYPLVTVVLFGGMLIYLAINKNAREMAKRKLFF